ncbi:hypothetical protein Ciccas_008533 [Cichlidogyrus casuarinus]|uniref:Uncharacterized protein n=1 Tax=Cichlidogyrus casuarinus TaxID=1844966 RepID=A0ABD2PZQ4_9PLAT
MVLGNTREGVLKKHRRLRSLDGALSQTRCKEAHRTSSTSETMMVHPAWMNGAQLPPQVLLKAPLPPAGGLPAFVRKLKNQFSRSPNSSSNDLLEPTTRRPVEMLLWDAFTMFSCVGIMTNVDHMFESPDALCDPEELTSPSPQIP